MLGGPAIAIGQPVADKGLPQLQTVAENLCWPDVRFQAIGVSRRTAEKLSTNASKADYREGPAQTNRAKTQPTIDRSRPTPLPAAAQHRSNHHPRDGFVGLDIAPGEPAFDEQGGKAVDH